MNYASLLVMILIPSSLLHSADYHTQISLLCRKITSPDIIGYSKREKPGVYTVVTQENTETGSIKHQAHTITTTGDAVTEKALVNPSTYFNLLHELYIRDQSLLKALYTAIEGEKEARQRKREKSELFSTQVTSSGERTGLKVTDKITAESTSTQTSKSTQKTCKKTTVIDELYTVESYIRKEGSIITRAQYCKMFDGKTYYHAYTQSNGVKKLSNGQTCFEELQALYNKENPQKKGPS